MPTRIYEGAETAPAKKIPKDVQQFAPKAQCDGVRRFRVKKLGNNSVCYSDAYDALLELGTRTHTRDGKQELPEPEIRPEYLRRLCLLNDLYATALLRSARFTPEVGSPVN